MMEFFWLVVDLWTCNVSHLTSRQTLGNLTPPWIKVRNTESIGQSAKKEPICFFILTFKQKSVQNICQRFQAFVLSERGNSAVLSLQSGLLLIGGDVELNVLIIDSRYQNLLIQILGLHLVDCNCHCLDMLWSIIWRIWRDCQCWDLVFSSNWFLHLKTTSPPTSSAATKSFYNHCWLPHHCNSCHLREHILGVRTHGCSSRIRRVM